MKTTFGKQIQTAFAFALLLLLTIGYFGYRNAVALNDALKWEKHTQQVFLQLDNTLSLAVDAETGGRGFVITGNDSYLEPFTKAKQEIDKNLIVLNTLVAADERQLAEVKRVEKLINAKLDFVETTNNIRRDQGLEAASQRTASGIGKKNMDEIRRSITKMKETEAEILEMRENDLTKSVSNTLFVMFFGTIAGITSLGLANFTVIREVWKRRRAQDDLQAANKNLETRVTERTQQLLSANKELKEQIKQRREVEREREEILGKERAARKDAEIANRMRDEFLATVSHELRAPLNSILGWGRLLEKGNLDEPTSTKAVTTIVRNAESQNRLIEDLLDVSRIISGKLRLEVMTIKPINLVESALETVRPAAEAKGIRLEIKEDIDISHISGDPNRLQQVIWNLLSNAIKFTPNDGRVTLEIERDNDFVELRVKDTGVGIKEEFLPHVFDRFRQADASSIRKFGGLGLGLAIVRHITEMHGGTVDVFSEGENTGSTFTVKLPLITSPSADDEEKAEKSSALETSLEIRLDGLLILVVDDEEDTRQLLVQSLTFQGATVISADSAENALEEIKEKSPDVMVSDIGMPDEDGYSLIRKVRALPDERQRNIPAIALTAFTRAQDRMRALSSGFQSHVSKPVEPDELTTVIASLTGRLHIGDAAESK